MNHLSMKIFQIVAVLCFSIATVLLMTNVITRYVVMDWLRVLADNSEFFGVIFDAIAMPMMSISGLADEIPGYLLIWISLLGGMMVHQNDGHIAYDGMMERFKALEMPVYFIGRGLMVLFFATLTVQSIRMIMVGGDSFLETIEIPVGYFMVIIPIFGATMTLYTLKHMYHKIKG